MAMHICARRQRPLFGRRGSRFPDLNKRQRRTCPFCMPELMVATAAPNATDTELPPVVEADRDPADWSAAPRRSYEPRPGVGRAGRGLGLILSLRASWASAC